MTALLSLSHSCPWGPRPAAPRMPLPCPTGGMASGSWKGTGAAGELRGENQGFSTLDLKLGRCDGYGEVPEAGPATGVLSPAWAQGGREAGFQLFC